MDDSQLVEMTRASNQIFGSYPKVGGSNPSPAISNHQIGPSQDGPFCCPWGDERCSTRSSTELISFPMLTKCSQISKNAPHIGSVVLGSALTFVSWGSASCGSVS